MVNSVVPTYAVFHDASGNALDNGYIHIGKPGLNPETDPVQAYFDKEKTIPASQPIRTTAGRPSYNGSPASLYVEGDYSITVYDKLHRMVYSAGNVGMRFSDAFTGYNLVSMESRMDGLEVSASSYLGGQEDSIKDWHHGVKSARTALLNSSSYADIPTWAGTDTWRDFLAVGKEYLAVSAFMADDGIGDRITAVRVAGVLLYRDATNGTIIQNNGDTWAMPRPGSFSNRAQAISFASAITANGGNADDGDILVWGGKWALTFSTGATAISDAPGWVPFGDVGPGHFKDNTTPGTTDMTSAVQAAANYAHSLTDVDDGYGFCVPIDLGGELYALSSDGTYSVDLRGLNRIEFLNGQFVAIGSNWGTASWSAVTKSWSGIVPMFTLADDAGGDRSRFIRFDNVLMDCANKSAGISYDNADKCGAQDLLIIHQVGYALQSVNKNGEFRGTRITVAQFLYGETGWDDQNNRTADGFVMNTADHQMTDCVAKYCRYPLVRADGMNGQWINFHPYLGGLTTVTGDQIGLYLDDARGTIFVSLYLDKCSVWINGNNVYGLQFIGGRMSDEDNDEYFIIEADTANTDLAGLTITSLTGSPVTNGVRFDTTGSGSFASSLEWHVDNMRNLTGGYLNGFPKVNRPDEYNADGSNRTYTAADTINYNQVTSDFTTMNFQRGLVINVDPTDTSGAARSGVLITTDGGKALLEATPSGVIVHKNKTYTVATLPATPTTAQTAFVTDATATTLRSTVAGGGANIVMVMYDGTNWIIIG